MRQRKHHHRNYSQLPQLVGLLMLFFVVIMLGIGDIGGDEQVTGKLENQALPTPAQFLCAETEEAEQVAEGAEEYDPAWDKPARAARYINIDMTDEERDELAAVVYLEARGESADGQQAIAEVVFNRVLNDGFPDTVHDVLHEGEDTNRPQFSTVYRIGEATPMQAQYDAIDAALYGDTLLDADVVFFSRSGENDRVWGQIGGHIFCRAYQWEE